MSESYSQKTQVTQLLFEWKNGNAEALEHLLIAVEPEIRRLARQFMRREKTGHILQTTALINETFLQLIDVKSVDLQNQAHFFGLCARIMRRILIKYARTRNAQKRGGDAEFVPLNDVEIMTDARSEHLIALDRALDKLARVDELKSRIIELRFFGGLTIEETARVLGIAPITVSVNWRLARAWLLREISD